MPTKTKAIKCEACLKPIPNGRLIFLINNKRKLTCINCSTEQPKAGFMSYEHKTAGVLNICTQEKFAEIKKLGERKGLVSTGVKFKPIK